MSDDSSTEKGSALHAAWEMAVKQYEKIVEAELKRLEIGHSALERMVADDNWLRDKLKSALLRQFFVVDNQDRVMRPNSDMYGAGNRPRLSEAFKKATDSIENHIVEDVLSITEAESTGIYKEALKWMKPEDVRKMYLDAFKWEFGQQLEKEIKARGKSDAVLAAAEMADYYHRSKDLKHPISFAGFMKALSNGRKAKKEETS